MLNSNPNPAPMQVMPFHFETHEVKTILIDDAPFFMARDICDVLGLQDTNKALLNLEDDEKLTRKLFVSGQNREVWLINESGLYALIMRSNKAEAKRFRKWVTSEVLPSIRAKGSYELPTKKPYTIDPLSKMVQMEVLPNKIASVIPDSTHEYLITNQELARVFETTEDGIKARRTHYKYMLIENVDYVPVIFTNNNHNRVYLVFTKKGLLKLKTTFKQKRPLLSQATLKPSVNTVKDASIIELIVKIDDKEIRTQLFNKLKSLNII